MEQATGPPPVATVPVDESATPPIPHAAPVCAEEVDAERGFTEAELNTCLKVLHAFRNRLDMLHRKEYRNLRSAGIIFVDGISNRYFKGLSPEEYNHNKARKIARKERRKHEALEDQKRLAKTKMRDQKLRKMERLMESAASPVMLIEGSGSALESNGQPLAAPVDPLALGVVTVPAERVALRYNSERVINQRKRKNHPGGGQQPQQGKGKGNAKEKEKAAKKTAGKGQQQQPNKTAAQADRKKQQQPHNEETQKKREEKAKRQESEERRKEIESEDRMEHDGEAEQKEEESRGTAEETSDEESVFLHQPEECYICKATYHKLHHFYDRLCPSCAELNWRKRIATADLKGHIALVTGGRVKIGFETAVKLLRAGATVVVTTRFPHDAALRFAKLEDFGKWKARLHVYGLDMRYLQAVERFCGFMQQAYPHLDIIINNAAQTIRRPPAYYEHLISSESVHVASLPEDIRNVLHPSGLSVKPWGNDYLLPLFSSGGTSGLFELTGSASRPVVEEPVDADHDQEKEGKEMQEKEKELKEEEERSGTEPASLGEIAPLPSEPTAALPNISAALTQLAVTKGDELKSPQIFPPGRYDEHGQQVDLRRMNSWVLQLDQVSTVELAEVHVINALSPYTINSLLRPMLQRSPNANKFIINVSSVEGEFYHKKTTAHPHTNMAKASLNMMTRTAAAYYARDRIWMNAVDTGWISDMNPVHRSQHIANKYGEVFRNPIDEVDGAARILDPIFAQLAGGNVQFGKFLKDYRPSAW